MEYKKDDVPPEMGSNHGKIKNGRKQKYMHGAHARINEYPRTYPSTYLFTVHVHVHSFVLSVYIWTPSRMHLQEGDEREREIKF